MEEFFRMLSEIRLVYTLLVSVTFCGQLLACQGIIYNILLSGTVVSSNIISERRRKDLQKQW